MERTAQPPTCWKGRAAAGAEGGGQALPPPTPSAPPTPRLTPPPVAPGEAGAVPGTADRLARDPSQPRTHRRGRHSGAAQGASLFLRWTHTARGLEPNTRFRTSGSWAATSGGRSGSRGRGVPQNHAGASHRGPRGQAATGRTGREEAAACCWDSRAATPLMPPECSTTPTPRAETWVCARVRVAVRGTLPSYG